MSGSHPIEPRRGNNHAISTLAALLMAAVASVTSNQPVASQQNSTAAPKPAGTEIAPRGHRGRPEDGQGNVFRADAATGIPRFEPLDAHDVAAACPVRLRTQRRARADV